MPIHAAAMRAATPTQGAPVQNTLPNPAAHAATNTNTASDALAWCLSQYEAHHGTLPAKGGRNAWLTALAFFCNEKGVLQTDLEAHAGIYAQPDFTAVEIRRTIGGVYQREVAKHNSKPWEEPIINGRKETTTGTAQPQEPLHTPTIPPEVYAALPNFLMKCCNPFPKGHEQDVMLTAAFGVLSGCFHTFTGVYDGATVGAELYCFIIGPAANGKGGLNYARRLAYPTHAALVEESKEAQRQYEVELDQYNRQQRATGKAKVMLLDPANPPTPPPFRQLYLPANNSAAGVIKALYENDGRGIICETEADTLGGALKQDWGNVSDLMRKAYHREPVTYQRKTGREFYEIPTPCLSIILTGTYGQVRGIIPSAEDGLFSRFLFYYFDPPQTWRSVAPNNGRGHLTKHFDELSGYVTHLIAAINKPVSVELTQQQWQRLDAVGSTALASAVAEHGSDVGSVVKRLGLSTFRLAMLLTLLRTAEDGAVPAGILICSDLDFETALSLADTYRQHALALYARMPKPAAIPMAKRQQQDQKKERAASLHAEGLSLRKIASELSVSEGTIRNWLKEAA
jgi:hypothetical protein